MRLFYSSLGAFRLHFALFIVLFTLLRFRKRMLRWAVEWAHCIELSARSELSAAIALLQAINFVQTETEQLLFSVR